MYSTIADNSIIKSVNVMLISACIKCWDLKKTVLLCRTPFTSPTPLQGVLERKLVKINSIKVSSSGKLK